MTFIQSHQKLFRARNRRGLDRLSLFFAFTASNLRAWAATTLMTLLPKCAFMTIKQSMARPTMEILLQKYSGTAIRSLDVP